MVRDRKDVAFNRDLATTVNGLPDAQFGIAGKHDLTGTALQSKDGAARVLIGLPLRVNVLEETRENNFNTEAVRGNVPVAWINVVRAVTAFEPRGVWNETLIDLFLQDLKDSLSFEVIGWLILQQPNEFDLPSIVEQDCGHSADMIDVVVRKDNRGDPVDSQVVAQEFEDDVWSFAAVNDYGSPISEIDHVSTGLPDIEEETLGRNHMALPPGNHERTSQGSFG